MEPVYATVIGAVLAVFKGLAWDVRATGTEHIPRRGPAVLASNHVGYLDFVFIGYGARPAGRLVRFMAKQEIFEHRVAGPLMRAMRHIPVDRYGRRADALDRAAARLREGEVVGMFPEGTISRSFVPAKGHSGAARMAIAARAPLVPTAVWGSQRILTKGRQRNFQRRVAVRIAYGPPIPHGADSDPREVTAELMAAVRVLAERLATTYPQEPSGPSDRWWLPAHLGGTAPSVEQSLELARAEASERRTRRAGGRASEAVE